MEQMTIDPIPLLTNEEAAKFGELLDKAMSILYFKFAQRPLDGDACREMADACRLLFEQGGFAVLLLTRPETITPEEYDENYGNDFEDEPPVWNPSHN